MLQGQKIKEATMLFTTRTLNYTFLILLSLSLLWGCATQRKSAWDLKMDQTTLTQAEKEKWQETARKHWEKRHIKDDLVQAIKAHETLAVADRNNYDSFVALSRGHNIMGTFHFKDKESQLQAFEKGITWGERGLATNPEFKKRIAEVGGDVGKALDTVTKKEIEALFWTATNLGRWAKQSGIATILKHKVTIKKMIKRVQELDPNFSYASAERYWGAYYAVAPSFAGGDLKKSYQAFQQAFEKSQGYVGNHVLFAKYYATKKGDQDLFKKELQKALEVDPMQLSPEFMYLKIFYISRKPKNY